MAAYAAVVSLMNNMEQIMKHPHLSNCFDNQQLQSLLEKAGSFLESIEGHGRGGLFTEEAEALERHITYAAYAAEDVIESHVVDQIHAGTLCSLDLRHVIQDMGTVAGKAVLEVKEKEGAREEEEQHPTPHVDRGGSETAMVGLEDELTQLLDSLTDGHSNRRVISIVGMGGTGKTTLAQHIYNHPAVKQRFDIFAWATISQQHNPKGILSQLLSCLGNSANIVGGLGEKIHKTLFGRRYLIVLDDMWDVDAWEKVRRYFRDDGNSSRVVLTTRLLNVASSCTSACFDMNLLDEEKSWKLFCEKALFPLKNGPLQLEDVAKRIVKSCKGLALSIVVIGRLLLKSPRTVSYWENILEGLKTNGSKAKQQGLDALSLSYTHLPPRLKPCFLYLGLFEEDSEIRASKITKLWVAEGFIKPTGSRVLEEIAEEYLKDLNDKNLILVVKRHKSGTIKSFSIHDLLRDMCIKVGEETEFFRVIKGRRATPKGTERRIFYDTYGGRVANAVARTILAVDRGHPTIVGKCKLLRVLDKGESGDKAMAEVCGNVNLRYLTQKPDFTRRHAMELPSSVCLLWNLQTLIIRGWHGFIIVLAPPEIWKMRQLRHVKCDIVHLLDPPNRQDCMKNLQTLTRALNLRLSEEVCLIIPNIKKLSLIYHSELHGHDSSLVECLRNLDRLHKLESLNMKFSEDWKLGSNLAFPLSLKKLCLRADTLCWKDLLVIGSLPRLQVLHLKLIDNYSDAEHRWSPSGGQFLGLKYLKLQYCRLTSWDVDGSHFPVLEKLVLSKVFDLEEIPLEIGEIPTLELIRVKRCRELVAISALKIKKDKLENEGNDDLQIEIKIYLREGLENFKKRLEAEELDFDLLNKLEIRAIHA